MLNDYKRGIGETDEELIFRVCQDKELIGSWQDVADILNDLLDQEYTESKYRKQYQAFEKIMNANEAKFFNDDNYAQELKVLKQELQKEKQKLSDERVEFNKQIREQARRESFEDMIKRTVCENVQPIDFKITKEKDLNKPKKYFSNDVLAHITDIHTGIEIDNYCNKFDESILEKRLNKYVNKIISVGKTHNSENCYIVVSEILSGIIHNTLRIQNNLDLMEQFKYVCELLTKCFIVLSENFENLYVYTVMGNHSRISPKKEDNLQGENMDILFPYYMKARLQNYKNIHIAENEDFKDAALFKVRNERVLAVHGDKDSPNNIVQNWTMMIGEKPTICLLGHRHTNALTTIYDTKVIQSGCFCGSDEYALSIRKTNKPEQIISIISDDGLECMYDVQLD